MIMLIMLMMLMLMVVVFIGLPPVSLVLACPTFPLIISLQARVKKPIAVQKFPPLFSMILKQEVVGKCKNIQNILCGCRVRHGVMHVEVIGSRSDPATICNTYTVTL